MSEIRHTPHLLDAAAAARYLGVDEDTIRALTSAEYLAPASVDDHEHLYAMADLKAFVARNADNGSGNLVLDDADAGDPQSLLEALDGRSEEMARRAFEIFAAAFPEARGWSLTEQARFIEQATSRFEAILAVTGQGSAVDEALVGDLQDVGAAAAWAGSPLPHLLAILRISRDLVVQTAVELAEQRGRYWGLALSLLLTRILPAMDRLTDALAQGYWAAQVSREEELRDRYAHALETTSNGVFEVDLDGQIQYANPSLASILGWPADELTGKALADAILPAEAGDTVEAFMDPVPAERRLTVVRRDGVRRVLQVRTTPRRHLDELVGFQGIVEDLTTALDLEADKNEFLDLITRELRAPLATLVAQGSNLEAHADELPSDQVARMGRAVRGMAERLSRLADDLHDVSSLQSSKLVLHPRAVDLARIVSHALDSVSNAAGVEIRVPPGIEVLADARRLEQVIANLVENGLDHGAPPVVISAATPANPATPATPSAGTVELTVSDRGPGVDPALERNLFTRARGVNPRASRGSGFGLALVRGLVEAMGGTVAYQRVPSPEHGATFVVTLRRPRQP